MKNIVFLSALLLLLFGYSLSYAQYTSKLYRTENGDVYTGDQLNSFIQLNNCAVGYGKLKVINDTTYQMISLMLQEDLDHFIKKNTGKPLHRLSMKTLDGKTVTTEDLKGKVVMINFLSTTCKPCILEIPELNRLQEAYKDQVVFLALFKDEQAKVTEFLGKYPYEFQIVPDAGPLHRKIGVWGVPKNFFVGKDGMIKKVTEGVPFKEGSTVENYELTVFEDYSKVLNELIATPQ